MSNFFFLNNGSLLEPVNRKLISRASLYMITNIFTLVWQQSDKLFKSSPIVRQSLLHVNSIKDFQIIGKYKWNIKKKVAKNKCIFCDHIYQLKKLLQTSKYNETVYDNKK